MTLTLHLSKSFGFSLEFNKTLCTLTIHKLLFTVYKCVNHFKDKLHINKILLDKHTSISDLRSVR